MRWEESLIERQRVRYERTLNGGDSYRPLITPAVIEGVSIASHARSLRPDFVLGQEAFYYGLATAWCWGIPRILMPWGGDIFIYCDTTSAANLAVGYALRHVDLVVTGATSSINHLESRFEVAPERIFYGGCWRLDRKRFSRAGPEERQRIRRQFGIPPERFVVMNVRRFFPAWGSEIALDSCCRFARSNPAAHFIFLGGAGTEDYTRAARARIEAEHLTDRFLIMEGDQPLSVCAELMTIADVFLSLMVARDMRSGSVLQATAAGGVPLLSDQAEYRDMEADGFRAKFVKSDNCEAVVEILHQLAGEPGLREQIVSANDQYLRRHEDGDAEVKNLLTHIDRICTMYASRSRFLRPFRSPSRRRRWPSNTPA